MAGDWKNPNLIWAHADKKVVTELLRAADHFGADRIELVSMFETAIVESGLKAIDYGDRDSVGPFQQRAGWGTKADRIDPYKSALKYLAEARRIRKRFTTAGKLAYGVQRCAAAYKSRYSEALHSARYAIVEGAKLRSHGATYKTPVTTKVVAALKPKPKPYAPGKRQLDGLAWHRKESKKPTRVRKNECLRTVRIALACPGGTDWAVHVWTNTTPAKHKHTTVPPVGAAVIMKGGSKYGHAVQVEKPGKTWAETTVWSVDIRRSGKVDLVTIGEIERRWGMKVLGWVSMLNGVDLYK